LAGTVTGTENDPLAHDSVLGNPLSTGDDDTAQLVDFDTEPKSTTDPPVAGTVAGVAVNEPMVGFETAAPARGAITISPAATTANNTRPVTRQRTTLSPLAVIPTPASRHPPGPPES